MKNPVLKLAIPFAAILLTSCRLIAPSVEEEKTWLGEAGYSLAITDGNVDDPDSPIYTTTGIDTCIHATKDTDEIYLIYFYSIEWAQSEYDFIYTNLNKGQINQLIYLGTSQAIKDAKL